MKLSNTYSRLGDLFFQQVDPATVSAPKLFLWNDELARQLQMDTILDNEDRAQYFSGNQRLPGSAPVALAYAGHQFGNFVPQLGDGRAHLLGDLVDTQGQRREIQLKGSGPTAFSRNGDGRCAMGPAIREFIMGEAMHALGVPTTRSLAVVTTGETVYRESMQPGAVVTRVASSHLRVGTFEYFAARKNYQAVEQLVDFAIGRHYPEIDTASDSKFEQFLQAVMQRQLQLVVEWLRVGFIHGVMNTDNTALSGETIDYGPCAMMGTYNLDTVFSSIDRQGRYAYGNQPSIIQWNMARLAETLLPLLDPDQELAIEKATAIISTFPDELQHHYFSMLSKKSGFEHYTEQGHQLIADLLGLMEKQQLDYTMTFDLLTNAVIDTDAAQEANQQLGSWFDQWQQALQKQEQTDAQVQQRMRQSNPVVIPRNHHMEAVLEDCIQTGEADAAERFLEVLRSPYKTVNQTAFYQDASTDADQGYQTFCGT